MVLASATPSLETLWHAQSGRYDWLKLGARHGTAVLPDIALLDLRQNTPDPQTWLSQPLRLAIGETLLRGEQTLLFLNRRGYAPVVLCRACGHRRRDERRTQGYRTDGDESQSRKQHRPHRNAHHLLLNL